MLSATPNALAILRESGGDGFMDEYRKAAIELMLSSATEHRTDRQRALIVFAGLRDDEEREFVRAFYLAKRFAWLGYLSSTQRRFQSRMAKNPAKAKHHDSWATREKYIRCT
jgi:hypothetical protein